MNWNCSTWTAYTYPRCGSSIVYHIVGNLGPTTDSWKRTTLMLGWSHWCTWPKTFVTFILVFHTHGSRTSMVIRSIGDFLNLLNMGRIDVTARDHAYIPTQYREGDPKNGNQCCSDPATYFTQMPCQVYSSAQSYMPGPTWLSPWRMVWLVSSPLRNRNGILH